MAGKGGFELALKVLGFLAQAGSLALQPGQHHGHLVGAVGLLHAAGRRLLRADAPAGQHLHRHMRVCVCVLCLQGLVGSLLACCASRFEGRAATLCTWRRRADLLSQRHCNVPRCKLASGCVECCVAEGLRRSW